MKRNPLIKYSADYLARNRLQYLLVFLCLLLGTVIGSLSAIFLSYEESMGLNSYLYKCISAFTIQNINKFEVFAFSIYNNIKVLLFMWISALWIGLIPLGSLQVAVKGYKLGFTSAFIIAAMKWKGALLALILIIPHVIITFPALTTYAVFNINFAIRFRKLRQNGHTLFMHKDLCIQNLVFVIVMLVLLSCCSLIDAFVTPAIFKSICSLII